VALHLKELLESLSVRSFVKVSGSKGLHLTVPLNTKVTYESNQPFAKTLADLAARQLPDWGGVGHVKDLAPGQSADIAALFGVPIHAVESSETQWQAWDE
jgi:DNA primase